MSVTDNRVLEIIGCGVKIAIRSIGDLRFPRVVGEKFQAWPEGAPLSDLERLRDDITEALSMCKDEAGARSFECGCSCGAVTNWTPLLKEVQAGVHGTKACHPAGW